tara:strand:- start:695 stop:880 length:186 start_codon:yes stop_codon:yes gene_type:complete
MSELKLNDHELIFLTGLVKEELKKEIEGREKKNKRRNRDWEERLQNIVNALVNYQIDKLYE